MLGEMPSSIFPVASVNHYNQSMPEGYDSHSDYMGWVKADCEKRAQEVRATLVRAFAKFVEVREIEVINFSAMTAMDLAAAIQAEPSILKPLMAC